MYKMLIVDDKPHERRGIQEIIEWKDVGVKIVGTCANGRQALEKVAELQPDIVLSDISMSVMNGIEMAEGLKKTHPQIKIIFMSCYHDFNFAKSAVELDICGYVLKPIDPDELKKVVERVAQDLEMHYLQMQERDKLLDDIQKNLPILREQFLRELMLGNFRNSQDAFQRMEFLGFEIENACIFQVISLLVTSQEEFSSGDVEQKFLVSYTVKNIMTGFSNRYMTIFPIQVSESEYLGFIIYGGGYSGARNEDIPDIMETLAGIHNEITRKMNLSVKMGISKVNSDLHNIPELYRQSISALNSIFFSDTNPIILFEDIEDIEKRAQTDSVHMETLFEEIKSMVFSGTADEVRDLIDRYFNQSNQAFTEGYMKGLAYTVVNMILMILMDAGKSFRDVFEDEGVIWERLSKLDTIICIKQCLVNIILTLKDYLGGKNSNASSAVVLAIKEIIHSKYGEVLKISDISSQVYLSTRYSNTIFKKETGMTIFDYLVKYRVEMAKRLLRNPDSKVSVIAEQVGYDNASYFCLLFKKCTGLTPAEYKSRT